MTYKYIISESVRKDLFSNYQGIIDKYYETPEILYHYTNASGLVGIIESKAIWATDYRFLNDSSEISYGAKLVNNILDIRMEEEESEVVREFYRKCSDFKNDLTNVYEIYITCFCENGNLLSQWRGYGDRGNGYSIGIETKKINTSNIFGKIIYTKEEQENIVNNILDYQLNKLRKVIDEAEHQNFDHIISDFAAIFYACICKTIVLFKHNSFSEEKEWRFVHLINKYDINSEELIPSDYLNFIKYRTNDEYLIPYIEIGYAIKSCGDIIPIKEIVCGPSKQPEAKRISLDQFMKKNQYKDIEIISSDIPFRG